MLRTLTFVSHEVTAERRQEFVACGHRPADFFPHSLRFLPKAGPDGYKVGVRMTGRTDPGQLWEVVIYAGESTLGEFPRELFFDDDLVWHQQQFGLEGQLATADVVLDGAELWSMVHVADIVQRIGRRREHKTRIENRFRGWHAMLLNGLLAFAGKRGVARVYTPRSPLAMTNTDTKRTVKPELFERLYDRDVNRLFRTEEAGDWWVVDVAANRDRIVFPRVQRTSAGRGRIVCVCHDVERGLGHIGVDAALSMHADRTWRGALTEMLAIERAQGVRATYNVVGLLFPEVREEIVQGGHCLAFHSFDHRIEDDGQLERCRGLDYRLKGYRAPRSLITPELTDERLLFHNFEWIAASARGLTVDQSSLRDRLVRVVVDFDDFDLYREGLDFGTWQEDALATIESREVTVLSLHDCYADRWLPFYDEFLSKAAALGELWTVDDLAADLTLAAAE